MTHTKINLAIALTGLALMTSTTHAATPIAEYSFDNADLPEFDSAGSAVTTGQTGVFGEAYLFGGGANNLTTVPISTVPSGAAARTVSIWFNQSSALEQSKIWGYGAGTSGNAFDMSLEGGGVRLRHFGGNITYGTGLNFVDGVGDAAGWNHLAVRVNANPAADPIANPSTFALVDVFLNGTQLSVTATASGGTGVTLDTTDSVFGVGTTSISDGGASTYGFNGLLDELKIYDNALTNTEIASLAVIPEPSATALIGLAGLALFLRRRR
jgi:hypothetical protein